MINHNYILPEVEMTYENTKSEKQGTDCKLISSFHEHPIFCENEKMSALRYSGVNPEAFEKHHCKQAWTPVAFFLFLKGTNSIHLLKSLPTALEVLQRQRIPISASLGLGSPAEMWQFLSVKWTETNLIFNTNMQKECMSLLGLQGKVDIAFSYPVSSGTFFTQPSL